MKLSPVKANKGPTFTGGLTSGAHNSSSHMSNLSSSGPSNHTLSTDSTYKSMTIKMIQPSPYQLPPADTRRNRKIKETSAWTPGQIYVRDFVTQTHDSYENPSIHLEHLNAEEAAENEKRSNWEQARLAQRATALKKLSGVAKLKFGNMSNMLRAFKKNTGDTVTLPEFAEHLRRRNLDSMIALEDQELVWEQLKATPRGSIDVGSLSKAVDEVQKDVTGDAADMLALRDFLAQQVEERRKAGDLDKARSLGMQDQEDSLKKAIGTKTFDLDIGAEEMEHVVDDLFQKKHTKESHAKFSRFLRMTNVKLHNIPFYDLRSDELSRLKGRAKTLGEELMHPDLTTKLHTLRDQILTQKTQDLNNSRTSKLEALQKEEDRISSFYSRPGAASTANLKDNLSPVKVPRDLTKSASTGSFPTTGRDSLEQHGISEEKSDAYMPTSFAESAASAMFGSPDPSMYSSTYSEYYPPLLYEPNKPVTRENISDADAKVQLRNKRRFLRQQRTVANTKVTKDRLEMERLAALNRQLNGERARTEDMIRYQSTVFLHDLKCYKKLPLQTMAKKPNLTKSDAMWGGSQRYDSTSGPDNRDFQTTFKEGFKGHPAKSEPTIDIEARVKAIWASKKGH